MLRIRIEGSTTFQISNLNKKVSIIECVRTDYVVIVLRAVDDDGKDMEHQHSIVIDCKKDHARFDLENLMAFIEGTKWEPLNAEFTNSSYTPWVHNFGVGISN